MSGVARRRRVLGRLGAALGATLVALLAVELWVRWAMPVGGFVYRLDDARLHDARPNARTVQRMPRANVGPGDAARVVVRTGAEGFRGESLAPAGEAERPRILVVGDSLVMAENVPFEATFVERLEAEFGGALDAINAGRSGYGPDQALLLLEAELERVRPALTLFVVCAHNDLGDLMRNKLFRLGADGALVACEPRIGQRLVDFFAEGAERAADPGLVRLVRFARAGEPSALETLPADPMPRYLAALAAQYREHWITRDPEVVSLFEDIYDADVALGVAPEAAAAKEALLAALVARAVAAARAGGCELRFVVVPSAVDVCEDFALRVDRERYAAYDPERLVATAVRAIGAGGGVALDLTPALAGPGGRYRAAFVGGTDVHWNAVGQGRAAAAVAAWLRGDPGLAAALGR